MATPERRSPAFVGVALTIVAVAYFTLVYSVATHESGLRWILLGITTVAVIVFAVVALNRRSASTPELSSVATPDDGSWRVLVVVDDGGTSEAFREQLLESAAGRAAKAFVVAPALSSRLGRWTGDQGAYDQASDRLGETLEALGAMGVDAKGRIGAHDPLQAAADGLRQFPADAIIFATHAEGRANWLEQGVVETARARTDLPVAHVVVD